MAKKKGHLIAIEGIDAVGKKTQTLSLDTSLRKMGLSTKVMEFPDYETPIGKEIKAFLSGKREYPVEVRHMLFAANRWEKLVELRSVDNGINLIVNRYSESNLVYGVANGLQLNWLLNLESGLPKADLVILLDAPPALLKSRRTEKDEYERDLKLQRDARTTYRRFAKRFGWSVVPAEGTPEATAKSVLDILVQKLMS